MQAAQEELITVHSKLEKQQQLNEKLETDLLEIEKHQQTQPNGKNEARDGPKNVGASDALAGIDLGKKPSVRFSLLDAEQGYSSKCFTYSRLLRELPQSRSRQTLQTPRYYQSLQVSETGSGNETLNSRRYRHPQLSIFHTGF